MATLERLERQAGAIESILGIVRTMKALAAVNIPAAERAAASASAFHETVLDGLGAAWRAMGEGPARAPDRPCGRRIAIAFGTDHGLCGGFNEAVAEAVRERAADAGVFAVGSRLAVAAERRGLAVERVVRAAAASDGLRGLAAELILAIDEAARTQAPDVLVLHQVRTAGGGTEIAEARLLPLAPEFHAALAHRPWPTGRVPLLPTEPVAVFRTLTQQHLALSLYRAGAQSLAAEHTTRLALMSHAERELDRRREEIGAAQRRTRQAQITDELLDIVSGFEAIGAATSRSRGAGGAA